MQLMHLDHNLTALTITEVTIVYTVCEGQHLSSNATSILILARPSEQW